MKCGSAQGHGLNILQDVHCVWRTFTLLQQAKQHWRVMQSQRITKSEKPNDVMQISDFSHDTASASSMQSDTTVPSSASVTEQDHLQVSLQVRQPVNRTHNTLHLHPQLSWRVNNFVGWILWTMRVITSHYSYNSSTGSDQLFKKMFLGSQVAAIFSCGDSKLAYLAKYGTAPFFTDQ